MKKRLAVVLSAIMALTMFGGQFAFAASGDQFTDVPSDAWYKPDVDYVAENDYMIGTSDTTFEPQSNLTRAMFATILARYDGAEVDDSVPTIFTDVEVNQWFTGSIGWANEKKIVEGRGDNIFDPTSFITRQELAVMVERYITYVESTTDKVHVTPGVAIPFTDADQISDYAKDAMDKAVIHGLIIGYPDKSVKPLQNITRAETAAVIHRIKWKTRDGRENYTLTYKDKDGNVLATVDAPVGQLVVVGKDLPNPEAPEGMTFVGWQYTAPDGTVITYHPGDKIQLSDDMVLIPIFSDGKEAHDITLIDAVDDSEISKTTVPSGETFKIPEGREKSGYTFKEWNTQKDGKGTTYKPESTIELVSDMTLYAIYTRKSSGGSSPTQYYRVVAEINTPIKIENSDKTAGAALLAGNYTASQKLTAETVLTALFGGSNKTKVQHAIESAYNELDVIHKKEVQVEGTTYTVTANTDRSIKIETPDGVVKGADLEAQLQVDQKLYDQRMKVDIPKAAQDKLADPAKWNSAAWNAAVDALAPTKLMKVSGDSLTLMSAEEYATAVETAATNLGKVMDSLGDNYDEAWAGIKAFLTEELDVTFGKNDKMDAATLATALASKQLIKPFTGTENVALNIEQEYDKGLLNLFNTRFSRHWAADAERVPAIVALWEAFEKDQNNPFLGKYQLNIRVEKADS